MIVERNFIHEVVRWSEVKKYQSKWRSGVLCVYSKSINQSIRNLTFLSYVCHVIPRKSYHLSSVPLFCCHCFLLSIDNAFTIYVLTSIIWCRIFCAILRFRIAVDIFYRQQVEYKISKSSFSSHSKAITKCFCRAIFNRVFFIYQSASHQLTIWHRSSNLDSLPKQQ